MITPPPSPKRADGVCAAAIPATAVQHTASKLSIRRCIACRPGEVCLWLPYRPLPTRRRRPMIRNQFFRRSFPPATRPQLVVAVGGGSAATPDNPDAVMGSHPRHQVVVTDHADRPVWLEHSEQHVLHVRHAVLAQRLHHLVAGRSEEHTSELQTLAYLVCRLLLEKKKKRIASRSDLI